MKISIIGTGNVGSTLAFAIIHHRLCNELVLVNRTHKKAMADALDLTHAMAFTNTNINVSAKPIEYIKDSDIVVITVSEPMDINLKDRNHLINANINLIDDLGADLRKYTNDDTILIVISNPIDLISHHLIENYSFCRSKILGLSTIIETARFRTLLSSKYNIHPDDLRFYIVGEHGPHCFPLINKYPYDSNVDTNVIDNIFKKTLQVGFDIFNNKGYTNFAITEATVKIIESIKDNSNRILPISTHPTETIDRTDACISIPVIVNNKGIVKEVDMDYTDIQITQLHEIMDYLINLKTTYVRKIK